MYSNILWQKISSAVLALGSGCGDVISRLKTECMDPAAEADYQQLLSDWKKDDDVVKEMLERERTQDTLGEIEENQERTNIKLGEVKGYHGEIKPDQAKQCDLRACNISTQDKDWTLLHGCFHFFHNECLNGSTSCPLCKDFLKEKVKDLGSVQSAVIPVSPNVHVRGTQQIRVIRVPALVNQLHQQDQIQSV
ncbi:uncharacterized protein LOC141889515 isoform X6 [Acropora palmata]|uniref:uncharacterized protein LOC141889515 isoform X6 n=1 Tax=Acropora palmata TaxID=6131 RepID=UPI003DA01E70